MMSLKALLFFCLFEYGRCLVLPNIEDSATNDTESFQEKFPFPRILLLGQTGSGKSSLGNALLGHYNRGDGVAPFDVAQSGSPNSQTKRTTPYVGPAFGNGSNWTIIDTPGFGDTEEDNDDLFVEGMLTKLAELEQINAFVVMYKYETKMNREFQDTLKLLKRIFGKSFSKNVIIAMSYWSYKNSECSADEDLILNKKYTDPDWTCPLVPKFEKHGFTEQKYSKMIKETPAWIKSGLPQDTPVTFVDSWYDRLNEEELTAFEKNKEEFVKRIKGMERFRVETVTQVAERLKTCQTQKMDLEENRDELNTQLTQCRDNTQAITDQFKELGANLTASGSSGADTANKVCSGLNMLVGLADGFSGFMSKDEETQKQIKSGFAATKGLLGSCSTGASIFG